MLFNYNHFCFEYIRVYFIVTRIEAFIKNDYSNFIEGESTEFKCIITNINYNLISQITWFHNENIIKNNESGFEFFDNFTLKITSLSHSFHNGDYYCQIDLISFNRINSSIFSLMVECK